MSTLFVHGMTPSIDYAVRIGARRGIFPTSPVRPLATIRRWIARNRQRQDLRELAELNTHLLQDIGLSRGEALREAAKPFWRR